MAELVPEVLSGIRAGSCEQKVDAGSAVVETDLPAAWQIGPRCHILRTLPPQSENCARTHDGMERVMRILVGISGELQEGGILVVFEAPTDLCNVHVWSSRAQVRMQ